jgi:hypothetical protein
VTDQEAHAALESFIHADLPDPAATRH